MFLDYYSILDLNFNATREEIRSAYKTQALKWHPDKNPGVDTTLRMQQINEAHLILKDDEARQRYDIEYQRYKNYQTNSESYHHEQSCAEDISAEPETFAENMEDDTYEVYDETLNKWMFNARKQAVDLAKQTIEDIIGMSKAGGKAMGEQALAGIFKLIGFSIVMAFLFKACH